MGCIDSDGSLTVTAVTLLKALAQGPLLLTEITVLLKVPGFMARGNLRELETAGLIRREEERFHITAEGRARL
jgi:predicted transcriptional regulator